MSEKVFCSVALNKCREYDIETIHDILQKQFEAAGITGSLVAGKKVVIKPNLVMSKSPDHAATTHPAVIAAAARNLFELGADSITIAESWGGPYTEALIKNHYKGCGIQEIAEKEGILLNTSAATGEMKYPEGIKCRRFNIIEPIREADVIVNISKLKTHSLTGMSAAVKNFFGTVPGVEKFEMHARFPEISDFSGMICDLCEMLCKEKEVIAICDGIVGMEGNGPTGGSPKAFGVLLTSRSPFCLDLAAEALLDLEGTTTVQKVVRERGLCPDTSDRLSVIGDAIENCRAKELVLPDAQSGFLLKKLPTFMGGRLARVFQPRPIINKTTCVGCGKCKESCPMHTITIVNTSKGKKAKIDHSKCIHCYCCQELCPINSVKIKKNFLIKLVH